MLTIVNKIYRKEVYILSGNVENYRTVLTLFYILYSTSKNTATVLFLRTVWTLAIEDTETHQTFSKTVTDTIFMPSHDPDEKKS